MMEGLATASSVAGVLSLAGQTIDGIVKLQEFFKSVKGATRTIETFMRDINMLIKTIEDVKSMLSKISEALTKERTDLRIIALKFQLQDCSKDIYDWLKLAQEHHPGFSTGTKAGFKKFWVAANKAGVLGISQEVKEHRNSIVASLSVLGRALDVSNSEKLAIINDKLNQETEDAMSYRHQSTTQLLKIDSLEEQSLHSLQICISSNSELRRIPSSLSKLEKWVSESQSIHSSRSLIPLNLGSSSILQDKPPTIYGPTKTLKISKHPNSTRQYKKGQMFALSGSSASKDSFEQVLISNDNIQSPRCRKRPPFIEEASPQIVHEIAREDSEVEFDHQNPSSRMSFSRRKKIVEQHHQPSKDSKMYRTIVSLPNLQNHSQPSMEVHRSTTIENSSTCSSTFQRISDMVKTGAAVVAPELRSYITKMRLAEMIRQEIALTTLHSIDQDSEQEIQRLKTTLLSLETRIKIARNECLKNGHALHPVNEILNSCRLHDPLTGLLLPTEDTSARHNDLLALRRKPSKLASLSNVTQSNWTSKLDRINGWLFHNLQSSSENAALHRSMLPDCQSLDEKSWARSVIKYWSIDEAAMGEENLASSSWGAVGSWSDSVPKKNPRDFRDGLTCKIPRLIRLVSSQVVEVTGLVLESVPSLPQTPSSSLGISAVEKLNLVFLTL